MRLDSAESQHLTRSVLLEESGSPFLVRMVIWFFAIILGLFIFWSTVTVIEEVANTQGEIVPVGHVQRIQHHLGGRIAEITVADGQAVAAGQILLKIDSVTAHSELKQLGAKLKGLRADKTRLDAFTKGGTPVYSALNQGDMILAGYQLKIFEQTLRSVQANRDVIQSQIEQLETEISEMALRRKFLRQQLKLLNEELTMRTILFKKGLNSKTLILALRRQLSELQGDADGIPVQISRIEKKIQESRARIQKIDAELIETALEELAAIETEIATINESIVQSQQSVSLSEIRAPQGGIVHGLKTHTVGGVIAPGQTVLEIVPIDQGLIAEIRIDPKEIGHISIGQDVTLKFSAYDFVRIGAMVATLEKLSATTFMGDDDKPYYKGIVPLDRRFMSKGGNQYPILPGMTVEADIITGDKTVIEYLLKPIFVSAQSALRER